MEPPSAESGTVPLQEGRAGGASSSPACGGTDHTHSCISSVLSRHGVCWWAELLQGKGKATRGVFFFCGEGLLFYHSELFLFYKYVKHLPGTKIYSTKQGTLRDT